MKSIKVLFLSVALAAILIAAPAAAQFTLVDGLEGASGSAVGPDGALYLTERLAGRISRVDPWSGDTTTFAEGLPIPVIDIGVGGVTDVAFIDGVAYALVTVVGPAFDFIAPGFGGPDPVGIYRVDGPADFTLVADLGTWSKDHPPATGFFLDHGVQYALETFQGTLLVSDGHHNRILQVTLSGAISEFEAFGNIVPTGLEVHGNTVYMARAGAVPHTAADGRVLAITVKKKQNNVSEMAAGAPLAVDVERGPGMTLFVLAQGEWDGVMDGSPAIADDGQLLRINADGSMTSVADGLNQPTSVEFIGNTAYVVSLDGSVTVLEDVAAVPFGVAR